ncbi:MAG: PAS domain-containing protein [Desulfobacterales bacterium]|nr:PAS domain-containing protein [Desulfobacterales bacterium]
MDTLGKIPLNIAIVGGGRACKFFLERLLANTLPFLDIHVLGVCDIDPEAEGLRMARDQGIYTTDNFRDLFGIESLDSIIELTNRREVLLELIKLRPRRIGVVEHNIGRFLRSFFLAEEKLKSAEHQVLLEKMSSDFLIQQSDAAIALLNTDFTIDDVNEAYLKLVDKSKAEVIGGYCYQINYGLSAPCASARPTMPCPMLETLKTGKSAHVIQEFSGSGTHPIYSNIVTYPLIDPAGEIVKIIEIWRDITKEITSKWENRAEALKTDLNRMVQEDRMISMGKLAASCVHEINNPIQGLLTFADLMAKLLEEENPKPADIVEFRGYLSMMSRELERCGNIVSGLLAFSHETPLEYTSVDINAVLNAVIMLTRHRMKLQNIELKTRIAKGIVTVRGNANRLQQALLNLIFNAIEAMPDGGRMDITSKPDAKRKTIRIGIEDSGTGIPKDCLDHIFDPFFTTKAQGEGTGLGLSIVYGIARNHGGKIRVQSEVGRGTVFTLELPVI